MDGVWEDVDEAVRDDPPGRAEAVPGDAIYQTATGTLVGLEDDVPPSRSIRRGHRDGGDDLLILRHYQLQVQGQRNQHQMQGRILVGILIVIMTTIVFPVVAVGAHWITEDFAQQIISLVLTAALSGLGGAVAWAFHGVSNNNESQGNQK